MIRSRPYAGSAGPRRQERLATAEERLRPWLAWHRRRGDTPELALVLAKLDFIAEQRGDADRALAHHRDGLAAALATKDPRSVALALEGLAGAPHPRPSAATWTASAPGCAPPSTGRPSPAPSPPAPAPPTTPRRRRTPRSSWTTTHRPAVSDHTPCPHRHPDSAHAG
ncbi:hypothetical protein ACFVFQ_10310 [Streptomyces sp. NPDC057743]|uniref:hypothetical protein n=1 Tax=Streptomyces sp. NPDC057743 TaxID=3346236 RepID=UPI0036BEFAF1